MRIYIILALIAVFAISCDDYSYPDNEEISTRNGALIDSSSSYLLSEMEFGRNDYTFNWNVERLAQLNHYYLLTSEPVLYNYYLGREIYRLVLKEENKEPLIFSINKEKKRSWIVSKKIKSDYMSADAEQLDVSLVAKFDNYTRELNTEEVQAFDSIFQMADFYHLPNNEVDKYYDSFNLLEAHEKGKYWGVYRSLEDSSLVNLSKYMRSLTGF